jgi:hypothetical protein
MKKEKCIHIKIPRYDPEHQRHANFLNVLISGGEIGYYGTLTRLAVMTAAGSFYRETCEICHGLSTPERDQTESG